MQTDREGGSTEVVMNSLMSCKHSKKVDLAKERKKRCSPTDINHHVTLFFCFLYFGLNFHDCVCDNTVPNRECFKKSFLVVHSRKLCYLTKS